MSADAVTNPPSAESKTARKKRAKGEATKTDSPPAAATPVDEQGEPALNGDSHETPYVKELQKQIRNVNKKLNAMSKLDAILAENQGVSLDDLVASRKINNDQREQALRKPGLQSSLAQLEEQIATYKKVDADYQARMSSLQDSLTTSHKSEIEALKAELQKVAEEKTRTELRQKLLTFSQFLRAAAAKRVNEEEADSEESRAFEGVLLLVYGGDDKAVDAAEKLINGSDDQVPSVEGTILSVKYSQVKTASLAHGPFPEDIPAAESAADDQLAPAEPQGTAAYSDPTIAHAGLTELGLNGQPDALPATTEQDGAIKEASTDDTSANAAAESQWDTNTATAGGVVAEDSNLDSSFEVIPRNPSETEAVHEPAQPQSINSWADDANTAAAETKSSKPTSTTVSGAADDGFHEVERRGPRGGHRGHGHGHGEGRGRGGRGRGGFRGEGRGRGRGGFRGDGHRGGPRGGPRPSNAAPAPAQS